MTIRSGSKVFRPVSTQPPWCRVAPPPQFAYAHRASKTTTRGPSQKSRKMCPAGFSLLSSASSTG